MGMSRDERFDHYYLRTPGSFAHHHARLQIAQPLRVVCWFVRFVHEGSPLF